YSSSTRRLVMASAPFARQLPILPHQLTDELAVQALPSAVPCALHIEPLAKIDFANEDIEHPPPPTLRDQQRALRIDLKKLQGNADLARAGSSGAAASTP